MKLPLISQNHILINSISTNKTFYDEYKHSFRSESCEASAAISNFSDLFEREGGREGERVRKREKKRTHPLAHTPKCSQ